MLFFKAAKLEDGTFTSAPINHKFTTLINGTELGNVIEQSIVDVVGSLSKAAEMSEIKSLVDTIAAISVENAHASLVEGEHMFAVVVDGIGQFQTCSACGDNRSSLPIGDNGEMVCMECVDPDAIDDTIQALVDKVVAHSFAVVEISPDADAGNVTVDVRIVEDQWDEVDALDGRRREYEEGESVAVDPSKLH